MKQTKKIILIGAGGHAASISDAILSSQRIIKGYIDEKKSNEAVMGHKVYKSILEIDNYHNYGYHNFDPDNPANKHHSSCSPQKTRRPLAQSQYFADAHI